MPDREREVVSVDVQAALRNITQILQTDPTKYTKFGVYWWAIKALLKGAGYGVENLYMLGRYNDPEQSEEVPRAGLQETLRQAIEEFQRNMAFPSSDGRVELPSGGWARVYDEDAHL